MPAPDLGLTSQSPVPTRNAHHVISALLMKVVLCPSQTTQKPLPRGQGSRVQGQPPANGRDGHLERRQGWRPQDWAWHLERSAWEQSCAHTFPQLEAERARGPRAHALQDQVGAQLSRPQDRPSVPSRLVGRTGRDGVLKPALPLPCPGIKNRPLPAGPWLAHLINEHKVPTSPWVTED